MVMKSSVPEVRSEVKLFLSRFIPDQDIADDEDIFALGYVSSLFIIQLVLFAEKTFDISLGTSELVVDNFKTINSIVNLIERRLEA